MTVQDGQADGAAFTASRNTAVNDLTSRISAYVVPNDAMEDVAPSCSLNYDMMSLNVVKIGKKGKAERRALSVLSDAELRTKAVNSTGGELAFNIKLLSSHFRKSFFYLFISINKLYYYFINAMYWIAQCYKSAILIRNLVLTFDYWKQLNFA